MQPRLPTIAACHTHQRACITTPHPTQLQRAVPVHCQPAAIVWCWKDPITRKQPGKAGWRGALSGTEKQHRLANHCFLSDRHYCTSVYTGPTKTLITSPTHPSTDYTTSCPTIPSSSSTALRYSAVPCTATIPAAYHRTRPAHFPSIPGNQSVSCPKTTKGWWRDHLHL